MSEAKFPQLIKWPAPNRTHYDHPLCSLPENKILPLVKQHREHLLANPKHLAWCMWMYDLIHRACRMSGYETGNPKYALLEQEDWVNWSKEEMNTLYEAWCCTFSHSSPWYFDNVDVAYQKSNRTFDDWVDLKTNKNHRYCDMYPTRHVVAAYLLLPGSNCYSWNKDGFLVEGSDGVDRSQFWGYTQIENEIPDNIRKPIVVARNTSRIKKAAEYLRESTLQFVNLSGADQRKASMPGNVDLDSMIAEAKRLTAKYEQGMDTVELAKKKAEEVAIFAIKQAEEYKRYNLFIEPLSPRSRACLMPDNVHPSYVRETYRLVQMILDGSGLTCGPGNDYIPCTDGQREWAVLMEARCLHLLPELKSNRSHENAAPKT